MKMREREVDILKDYEEGYGCKFKYSREEVVLGYLCTHDLPDTSNNVYFLMNKDNIVYVGMTSVGFSRIMTHIQENRKDFDSVVFLPSDSLYIRAEEAYYIHIYKPMYNIAYHYNSNKDILSVYRSICKDRSKTIYDFWREFDSEYGYAEYLDILYEGAPSIKKTVCYPATSIISVVYAYSIIRYMQHNMGVV